jgi:hypothetical protein
MASKRVNLKNGRAAAVGVCVQRSAGHGCIVHPIHLGATRGMRAWPAAWGVRLRHGIAGCMFSQAHNYAVLARGPNNRNENVNKARMPWNPWKWVNGPPAFFRKFFPIFFFDIRDILIFTQLINYIRFLVHYLKKGCPFFQKSLRAFFVNTPRNRKKC